MKDVTVLEFYMDEIKLLSSLKTSSFAINSLVSDIGNESMDALDAEFPQNR